MSECFYRSKYKGTKRKLLNFDFINSSNWKYPISDTQAFARKLVYCFFDKSFGYYTAVYFRRGRTFWKSKAWAKKSLLQTAKEIQGGELSQIFYYFYFLWGGAFTVLSSAMPAEGVLFCVLYRHERSASSAYWVHIRICERVHMTLICTHTQSGIKP